MALALYRRYRPDTFDGVIGQDQVTVPLMRALDENKLTHAYLFSGPRGCGKTSSARILARCVNCAKGPTSHPCGECASCRDLATGGPGSIDVVEIDAASHNGVDDARELRERAGFAPARDRYKIFILDEAHMVTPQGFNALLKIVEEPPEHVMFIFATTEPDKVIGTIRSRTHHYPFRLVPPEIMTPYLEHVCEQEHIETEPGVLRLVTRAGGGSVRDTLSVLDQLMGGCVDNDITYDSTVALLGFTPDALLGEAIDAIIEQNGAKLYGIIQKVIVAGFDARRFVEDLLVRTRDLLVLTLGGDEAEHVLSDDAEAEDMRIDMDQSVSLAEVARNVSIRLASAARRRGITVSLSVFEGGGSEDVEVVGNARMIEEMLRNLMENAIRYNVDGGKVDVCVGRNAQGAPFARVADTGMGIPEDMREKVFERFFCVDESRSKETGGSGLGLAIVKHAAQLHGASVSISENKPRGSVFEVLFQH